MHQRVDSTDHHLVSAETGRRDEPEDLWELHEPKDRRQVLQIISFCYYALSPSTQRVIFFSEPVPGEHPAIRILGELRAYGLGERFVWYEIPRWSSPFVYSMISGLFVQMEQAGKLVVY